MSRESDDNFNSLNSTYTDHGAVLTADTEQFIIGQKVWVGGIRAGQIAYIGETHFAPGEWAGIVLDEPNGKNDGCVAGKRYFQCEPKKGIFSRLTRLTLYPLPGAFKDVFSPNSKMSPERSRTVSPTGSILSSFHRSPGKNGLTVGDRVIVSSGFGSRAGILRYLGETQFASGNWCGVELDESSGKNDGSVDGVRYFECQPKYGVFVPIAKVSLSPSSKKSRLSRAGSRESLTSIGTMNSIATTNTSRLRMSAQRKQPSSNKPVSSTKSQFSMQDLIREKQNHIEQLMIERDLDREEALNQALQFQKNISELKGRITDLERKLTDERKKTEDLQFNIDEATFCGDELNAQTQVFKEKITDLELKLSQISAGNDSGLPPKTATVDESAIVAAIASATEMANSQIQDLSAKLTEQANFYEAKITSILEEERHLHDNCKYLQKQNEVLQKELLEKDESLEKFSLSESGIENLRRELDLLKEEGDRERQQLNADFAEKLATSNEEVMQVTSELTELKSLLGTMESERTNIEEECDILKIECKTRDKQFQETTDQLAKLTEELNVQKTQKAKIEEILKAQQVGSVEEKSMLEGKAREIAKLTEDLAAMEKTKTATEEQLQKNAEELEKISRAKSDLEEILTATKIGDEEKCLKITQLQKDLSDLQNHVTALTDQHQTLSMEHSNLSQDKITLQDSEKKLKLDLEQLTKSLAENVTKLKHSTEATESLKLELSTSDQSSAEKAKEIERLIVQISAIQGRNKESTNTVQLMSAKVTDLEAQLNQLQSNLKLKEEDLEKVVKERSQQETSITEKTSQLEDMEKILESTRIELKKFQEDQNAAQKRCAELEELLKKSEEKASAQQLEIGQISLKYEAISTRSESLSAQNEVLQQDLITARTTSSESNSEIVKLREDLIAKQKALDDLQNDTSTERMQLESKLQEANQKLSSTAKEVDQLKSDLAKSSEELAKKTDILTSLEEKTAKQELALCDASRKNDSLQIKFESLATQNESLQCDLNSLRSTSTDSNTEILKLTQDLAAKQKSFEEHLDKSSTERMQLESHLQESKQRVESLAAQIKTLTQELNATVAESTKRAELLKQSEEVCGKQQLDLSDMGRKMETLLVKCETLSNQNETLQNDLATLRTSSADSNAEMLKFSEELSIKQKAIQELSNRSGEERIQLQSQLQEITQRLEASLAELESVRVELKTTQVEKTSQAQQFEQTKREIQATAQKELEKLQDKVSAEKLSVQESFQTQLKTAEKSKIALDEAISSLQNQIQLLQDELLKSQLAFKTKEEELTKQVASFAAANDQLRTTLEKMQNEQSSSITNIQHEKAELLQNIQRLTEDLTTKSTALANAESTAEKLQSAKITTSKQLADHESQVKSLETQLDTTKSQLMHEASLSQDYKMKIDELKTTLNALQTSNANMSATNAELSAALSALEQEKCETANNFELFEMEADQNVAALKETNAKLELEYTEAKEKLSAKDASIDEAQQRIELLLAELSSSKSALDNAMSSVKDGKSQIDELTQSKSELASTIAEKDARIQQLFAELNSNKSSINEKSKEITRLHDQIAKLTGALPTKDDIQKREELSIQLAEYKTIIDEMDEESKNKTAKLTELKQYIKQLEQQKHSALADQKDVSLEFTTLKRKAEMLESEKTREIVLLQSRINDLQSIATQKQNGGAATSEDVSEDSTAQINFLNSIIADMQRKNDTLKAKIEALEALPTDYTKPHVFDLITKRMPAPRMFCDICDEFDQHETEDCPLQASDDLPHLATSHSQANKNGDTEKTKERKLPEPRKYCESCEVFGHETGECDDDECY